MRFPGGTARSWPAGFFRAIGDGDVGSLAELLAADAVVYGDGGGTGPSWLRPISGGVVNTIRSVINPGKLAHLGPLADLAQLQRRRGE